MKTILNSLARSQAVNHIFFFVLGVFAVVYYQERMTSDAGYFILRLINTESVWVEYNRFILIFAQVLPYMGIKLGLNLKAITLLYSLNHVVFNYLIFLICFYIFNNKYAGILLLLLQTLTIGAGFFTPSFELYYGASLMVLFSVILFYKSFKFKWVLLTFIGLTVLLGHPFGTLLFCYVLAFHFFQHKFKYIKAYIFFALLILAAYIFKKYTASDYEIAKSNGFLNTLNTAVYDINYMRNLWRYLTSYYLELLAVGGLLVSIELKRKAYSNLAFIILVFLASLALFNVAFYGFDHNRYHEQVYFPLAFILCYPFTHFTEGWKSKSKFAFSIVAYTIICFRLIVINDNGIELKSRIVEMKSLIDRASSQNITKVIVAEDSLAHPANWSYAIESLIISSLDGKMNSVSICTDTDMEYNNNQDSISKNQYVFRRWEIYDHTDLNRRYFELEDEEYVLLK